jgi:hypothetical protein
MEQQQCGISPEVLPSMCLRLKSGRMILNITLPMKRIVGLRF